jgi:hypothetical protein
MTTERRGTAVHEIRVGPERELAELREYLGDDFSLERLQRHQAFVESELARLGAERFYRSSTAYLYDLTVFAMSATKEPYLHELARAVDPPARVLDYGCGIGSDGLLLLEAGYRVEFADFASPSTESCAGGSSIAASPPPSTTSTPTRRGAASTSPTPSTSSSTRRTPSRCCASSSRARAAFW